MHCAPRMLIIASLFAALANCGGDSRVSAPASVSAAKAITAFSVSSYTQFLYAGTINEAAKTIDVDVPFGTHVTALRAVFTITGASIKVGASVQVSGTTVNNYTNPVTFTVTAADGSMADYLVTVTVAPQPGSLDTTFGAGGTVTTMIGSSSYITAMVIQSDGKIVTGGSTSSGGNADFALARYETNGVLDATFGSGGIVTTATGTGNNYINAIAIQGDGKIVVAGYSWNGTDNDFALARYNANGTLDTSFGINGIVTTATGTGDDAISAVAIQNDGGIVVGGAIEVYSSSKFALARYNNDGSLDTAFGTGGIVTTTIGGHNDWVTALVIQSDGKIVAVGVTSYRSGLFSYYDSALACYSTNGSVVGSTVTAMGNSTIYDGFSAVALQSDDKIIAGGYVGNSPQNMTLVKHNSNGARDATFRVTIPSTSGFSEQLTALAIQQGDGKIIAVGNWYTWPTYGGIVMRYLDNSMVDATFGNAGRANAGIAKPSAVAVQTDGKIVIAGSTSTGSAFAIARLNP